MIANPLNTTNNTLEALMPTPPDFTTVYKWTGTTYAIATYFLGWDNPSLTLNPGEGCFINAPSVFTNTFVGEVMQSPNETTALANPLPAGFSIRSSMVPQAGTADDLGLTAAMADFDVVYKFNAAANNYSVHTYFLGWDVVPSFGVGEAFWVSKGAAGSWDRIFTVNTP